MMDQLISVIIPVYNVAPYIDKCVESVVNQTHKNLEIILIDDGSIDESGVKCDKWQEKDQRIKTIHTKNHGVSHARNIGLAAMHGDYVGFVDGDDWLEPDMYMSLLHIMLAGGADVSGGGYTREEIDRGVVTLRKGLPKCYSREAILREIFSCDVTKLLYWELCDKLFKRELVVNIRLDEDIAVCEDMLFFWQIMKRAQSFAYAPLFKYHYRMREGSAVHSRLSASQVSSFTAIRKIWEDSQDEPAHIRELIRTRYTMSLVTKTREMLIVDADRYQQTIKKNQKLIRNHFFELLQTNNYSMRMKFGLIFLCLPYWMCVELKHLISKKND